MTELLMSMKRLSLSASRTRTSAIRTPLSQQARSASILSSLSDVPAAYSKRIRRGRGASSGKGKTSGRGHKGQKQHGKVPAGFNGGQTPLEVVHGVRGFDNQFSLEMTTLNLDKIQSWIDQGRLDPSKPITLKELHSSRCTHGIKDGVKLLARNSTVLNTPIHITVSRASSAAIAAIEAAGGSVQTRYYTRPSIRRILRGDTHPTLSALSQPPASRASVDSKEEGILGATSTSKLGLGLTSQYKYRLPDPSSRKDIEYYRDPAHRGYLSYMLAEGQGPSLYFKTPEEMLIAKRARAKKTAAVDGKDNELSGAENRLW